MHNQEKDELRPYPEYRDSGVPWLGPIPSHWDALRAKYIFREVDERSVAGEETHLSMSQRFGLVESSRIDQFSLHSESYAGGKLCKAGDLVLNRLKAHLGVFAHAPFTGVVNPDYSVFRMVREGAVRYFEHVFKTPACTAEIRRATKGIVEGFWRLYTDDFNNIRVPLPPPDEQRQIVAFLQLVDNKIRRFVRNQRRLIGVLKEQKQAGLIHEYRTRLVSDTVTGKLDVRNVRSAMFELSGESGELLDKHELIDDQLIDGKLSEGFALEGTEEVVDAD